MGDCDCGTRHNPPPGAVAKHSKSITAKYDYVDEHGEVLYQVCRTSPKGFFQRRQDENDNWIYGLSAGEYAQHPSGDWRTVKDDTPASYPRRRFDEVRRVLYRLPELIEAHESTPVYVCEGEADVENLRSLGLVATTNPSGAGKWRDDYSEHLRGRHVVILPDNDGPGREHAEQVAKALNGLATSVKVLRLPGLPEKGDVSDWIKAGGTVERLQELVNEQPACESDAVNVEPKNRVGSAAELLAHEFPEPKYAINGLMSEGVTIFAGKPKLGKSWCALGIAVAVASGGRAFGSIPVKQGDVLYLALEDGPRRLQDRLTKVLGNSPAPERLFYATEWPRLNDGGIAELEAWLQSHPDARLIVIDTFKMVRPQERGKAKQLYDVDYEAMQPLAKFARDNGISVVVVHHTRKMESDDPIDLISGSFGLSGSADGIMVLKKTRAAETVLFAKGRDTEEQELALRWDAQIYGWSIIGNAEHLYLTPERRAIIDLIEFDGAMTPKQVAAMLKRNEGATRKLMRTMAEDGQLSNDGRGCYSVPAKKSSGNFGNSGNSTHSGNSGNYQPGEPDGGQSYLPLAPPGNPVNGSSVRGIPAIVTEVTGDTTDSEMDDEAAERAAIMEYEGNLPREEAERLALVGVATRASIFSTPQAAM
jgi:AAA domain